MWKAVEGTSSSPVGYVEGIYVEPEYQRLGFGSKMIEKGQDWARNQGCKEFASDARIENDDAIDFHTNIGFQEINRVVTFAKKLN